MVYPVICLEILFDEDCRTFGLSTDHSIGMLIMLILTSKHWHKETTKVINILLSTKANSNVCLCNFMLKSSNADLQVFSF